MTPCLQLPRPGQERISARPVDAVVLIGAANLAAHAAAIASQTRGKPARQRTRPPEKVVMSWGCSWTISVFHLFSHPLQAQDKAKCNPPRCPSRGKTNGHGPCMLANAIVQLIGPGIQESPPGAGHEAHFVTGHSCAECLDLVPVPGLRPTIDGHAVLRPEFRLGIQVEQDGSERAGPFSAMNLASQRECVLEQLCSVQVSKSPGIVAQPVADALVSAHPIAPDRSPVGIAQ